MSQSTKSQYYRMSLKTVATLKSAMCTSKVFAYPVPPKNAITIEGIFVHFKITFDSGVASADRKIESIGIANDRPISVSDNPTVARMIDVNLTADGNRVIDLKIDLSSLLDKTKVDYDAAFESDYTVGDKTLIYVKLPDALASTLTVGVIDIWKIDTLWTTSEIR